MKFLDHYFAHLGSKAYLMGTESHKINWHVYSAVAEEEDSNPSPTAYTLEVCMTELDRDLAAHFYKRPGNEMANEMTVSASHE